MQSPTEPCSWESPLDLQVDGFGCMEQLEESGRGPGEQARSGQLGQCRPGDGEAGSPSHRGALRAERSCSSP